MNEGAVQRRVASAHLLATVPPLCQCRLCSLPCTRLSPQDSGSLLRGSKILRENQKWLECLFPLNFTSPLHLLLWMPTTPSLGNVNPTLAAQLLVLSLSLSAQVPGPGSQAGAQDLPPGAVLGTSTVCWCSAC